MRLYLEVVGFVVVHVQRSEQLGVPADRHVFDVGDAVNDCLAGKLLHLDVVELPEVAKPLDQLRRDAAVELGDTDRETDRREHDVLDSFKYIVVYISHIVQIRVCSLRQCWELIGELMIIKG